MAVTSPINGKTRDSGAVDFSLGLGALFTSKEINLQMKIKTERPMICGIFST